MEKQFQVNIVTPEKIVYSGMISSMIVPAELGYLGILANHVSFIANLVPGKISMRDGSKQLAAIDSKAKGFLKVLNNNVTLLLDYI
jgi:F-type H+-transporting ATPase subunit epsilon